MIQMTAQAVYSHGLSNHDTPDISELTNHRKHDAQAFCNSHACTRRAGISSQSSFGARKGVGRNVTDCPDCGYALFWRAREVRRQA